LDTQIQQSIFEAGAADAFKKDIGKNPGNYIAGQVERMNRTVKDATVKRYYHDDHAQLRRHLADFIDAYNFVRRLKTLRGLTPYEFICKCWTSEPERFKLDPLQKMPRLNT
jgi:Integrase core domain